MRFGKVLALCCLLAVAASGSLEIALEAAEPPEAQNISRLDALFAQGKFQQARLAARELLLKQPHSAEAHLRYARLLLKLGEMEEAIGELEKSTLLNPHGTEAFVALSQIYQQNLDLEKSLKYARLALDGAPSSAPARIVLVSALMQSDRIDEAEHQLSSLLSREAANPQVLLLAYQLKVKKGDFGAARRYLQTAIAMDPKVLKWQLDLSDLYESAGDHEAARRFLEKVLDSRPDSLEARLRLARNLEVFDKDYDGAKAQYQLVLQSDPDSPAASTGVERCRAKKNNLALRLKLSLQSLFQLLSSGEKKD